MNFTYGIDFIGMFDLKKNHKMHEVADCDADCYCKAYNVVKNYGTIPNVFVYITNVLTYTSIQTQTL